jgi:lipopolysaccharide assembly LptE-like protein
LLVVALACGYAPVRGKPAQGLRVAAVRNDTAQAEAGGVFAAELRRELAGRGRLEPEGSSAPELAAELVALRSVPSGVGAEGGAASYRLDAELRVRTPDYEDAVTGGEEYLTGVDVLGTEANRRAALRRLARTLAAEAIERYEVNERFGR